MPEKVAIQRCWYKREGMLGRWIKHLMSLLRINAGCYYSLYLFSVLISFIIIMLFPLIRIKFFYLFSDRIGHYALNTEQIVCVLKELRNKKSKKEKYFFYTSSAPICNEQLHKMWSRLLTILPCPNLMSQIDGLLQFLLRDKYYINIVLLLYLKPFIC